MIPTDSPGAAGSQAIRQGFTFVEILCVLILVGMGMMAVLSLVVYGMAQASRSQGRTTGMPTAISVAMDPSPLLPAATSGAWSYAPYALDGTGTLSSHAQGYLNGFWVQRNETSSDQDVIARDPGTGLVHARSAGVAVDVYDTLQGNLVASFSTRIIRQRSGP